MNITFDKSLKQRVFQAISKKAKYDTCPFCEVKITGKNFAGAAWIYGEFRMFDGALPCLLGFVESEKELTGMKRCNYNFKRSWWCSRIRDHSGPCALRPKWWNFVDRWRFRKMK